MNTTTHSNGTSNLLPPRTWFHWLSRIPVTLAFGAGGGCDRGPAVGRRTAAIRSPGDWQRRILAAGDLSSRTLEPRASEMGSVDVRGARRGLRMARSAADAVLRGGGGGGGEPAGRAAVSGDCVLSRTVGNRYGAVHAAGDRLVARRGAGPKLAAGRRRPAACSTDSPRRHCSKRRRVGPYLSINKRPDSWRWSGTTSSREPSVCSVRPPSVCEIGWRLYTRSDTCAGNVCYFQQSCRDTDAGFAADYLRRVLT